MGKSYGMSEEASAELEIKLQSVKDFIRDEGGDPKQVLGGMLGFVVSKASAPSGDTKTKPAPAQEPEPEVEEEAAVEPEKAQKMAVAISAIKRKMGNEAN